MCRKYVNSIGKRPDKLGLIIKTSVDQKTILRL